MDCKLRKAAWLSLLLLSAAFATVRADHHSAEAVTSALTDLHTWLGDNENGMRWQEYLMSAQLQAEVAKGKEADKRVVAAALRKYRGSNPSLSRLRFDNARRAIQQFADEIGVSPTAELAIDVEKASPEPVDNDALNAGRTRLLQAVSHVERFLQGGSGDREVAWKTYLEWNDFANAISQPAIDADQLETTRQRLMRGDEGLELGPFSDLRRALDHYKLASWALSNDSVDGVIKKEMESLVAALEKDTSQPQTRAEITRGMRILARLGQQPALVQRIQNYFQRNNLRVFISGDYISQGLSQSVNETAPIRENILGTSFSGNGTTTGFASTQLVPDPNRAVIDIVFSGNTYSRLRGLNGPVTVFSSGNTTVNSRKRLFVDINGVESLPATARCVSGSNVDSIQASRSIGSRIVERIAWNRANSQRAQAQQIASRRAEIRAQRRMDERAAPLIADANAKVDSDLKRKLTRRNLYPKDIHLSTTNQYVIATGKQANEEQLAAPNSPPPVVGLHRMIMQLHETAIINSAESAVAGMRLTDERVVELLEEANREVPEALKISEDKDAWSMTFDWNQPLSVQFNDRTVKIGVRGQKFVRGDRVVDRTMEIGATYEMAATPTGVRLTRQGDVEVTFPGREGDQQSILDVGTKTFFQSKFESLFKEEIVGEGIELPGRFANVGKLRLTEVGSSDGWLTLAWD